MTNPSAPPVRPPDVDTGFWLWVVALPLMLAGYLVDLLTGEQRASGLVLAISVVFVVLLAAVVVTFLLLMRQGYRWARTLLTGGAIATVVYSVSDLFTVDRHEAAALGYAAAVIIGSVLIGGGTYLLHRKDAHEFFTR
ncbi:hypothetical protein [Mycolicibacterium psychrotolerans]|uniref:Uncharacterized protein n=1 Tax=Mycolicibacterium psychrotolerans TaxID=216929 RepID=A0A7I7M4H4_9MYCO|nr:hypothetical protein [Mycolicibacterium psychrotolerans]KRE27845.1 hypothetical protein ASG82_15950 [Mycobacterium sp. Soil538]BBX66772.1 hypothetical protein MPSYJ_02330 [Mycolicibacterium psychrotolerans]